jgi:capsular polysaccharide transport system permease protein
MGASASHVRPNQPRSIPPPGVTASAKFGSLGDKPRMVRSRPIFLGKIKKFGEIMLVLMLMDMRTRFGRSYISYIIAIGWPLVHLLILVGIYILRNNVAPIGDRPAIFIATGVIPYILCVYIARMLGMSVAQGRSFLNIPAIKPIHLIASRWVLEILNAVIVLFIFGIGMWLYEGDIFPMDPNTAADAVFASIFLGVGLGVLNATTTLIFGIYFPVIFILFITLLYILSGVYIPAAFLPEEIREYSIYNPLFNLVEWLRSAYFTSYDLESVNKLNVLGTASVCLVLGLLGERYFRGKFFN